jgi:hypothetical protein
MTAGSLTGYSLSLGGVEVGSLKGNSTTGEIRIGGTYTNYFPTFYSSGSERAKIDSSGNLLVTGGGKISLYNAPPNIGIDGTNATVTVTNGNSIDFVAFSGTLMLTETNFLGGSAILLAGGAGSTAVVSQTNGTAYTATSGAGDIRWFYNSGTNAIRLQNNSGGTLVFNIVVVKTRNSI